MAKAMPVPKPPGSLRRQPKKRKSSGRPVTSLSTKQGRTSQKHVVAKFTRGPSRGKARREKGHKQDKIIGRIFDDWTVAAAIGDIVGQPTESVFTIMKYWEKDILKAPIPGIGGKVPEVRMLQVAKRAVKAFFDKEQAKQDDSHIVHAFKLVTGEQNLRFAWDDAKRRVDRARLDHRKKIDSWDECLAMQSGTSNATSEIYVCGTRKITLQAMTSLICHEALHNLARRTRPGNPYLSEDLEHLAMALLGDPQLAA